MQVRHEPLPDVGSLWASAGGTRPADSKMGYAKGERPHKHCTRAYLFSLLSKGLQ